MKTGRRSMFATSAGGTALASMMRPSVISSLIAIAAAAAGCGGSAKKPVDGGAGGAGDTCGSNVVSGCAADKIDKAPTNGVIADFIGGDGGLEIAGGLTTYGGIASPTYIMNTGSIEVMEAAGTSPRGPQYAGLVLFFNNCVNACAFQGVSFTIKGSMTGCTMQFSSNFSQDVCNDGTTNTDPKGSFRFDAGATCPAYSPQVQVTGITTTAQTMKVSFTDMGLIGGVPETVVDNGHLTAVQWQFTIPMAGDGAADACIADITISDVKFY